MTTHNLLRVTVTALAFTAACKSDFQAGINGNDGSAQEVAVLHDSGSPAGSIPWSCDPFNPTTKPITFVTVLGAGRDTDGTLYVVDQPQADSEQRVFVSSGGILQRQRVAGSGTESSGGGVVSYTLSVSDHVPPFTLKLETNAVGPTAMGVLQGTSDSKTFTIGQQGIVLTLVSTSQVAGLPVANIPAETSVEYNATLSDGRALLVVRPRDDWTYQDFRAFFGAPDHMVERPVSQVVRYQDGGSTTINFTVDGVPAVASFPVSLTGVAAPPTLTIGATKFTLTLGPIVSPPAGYSYFCLGNPPVDGGVDALSTPADGPAACRAPSSDYGPTSTFSVLPNDTPEEATTCSTACGNSAWLPGFSSFPNIDIALPYGPCAPGTPSCSTGATVPCACAQGTGGPVHGFNCSCEGGNWICRIRSMGGSMCMPCSDGGVGNTDGRKDASAVLRGVFAPTGSMGVARYDSTATLLGNGKVLVAGGLNPELGSSGKLRIAEVYDPAAGAFAATGSMSVGRTVPTATLLPSGKVLIAGEGSAELYDPSAGTFAATGSMTVARESHTATLLPNGLVLIAGGDYGNVSLASAELYDPSAGTFAATGSMTMARESHTATLLPSGMVLVAGGGAYGVGYLASAELFDPAARTFATTGSMTVARQSPTATLLGSGKVLIAGGIGGVGIGGGVGPLATADLFDPAARTFATTGSMTVARYGHTATLLESGMVLIVGGSAYGDGVLGSAELFDPVAGTFAATGSMIAARYGHTTTLLQSGIVLVAGGAGVVVAGSRYLTSAELYQ